MYTALEAYSLSLVVAHSPVMFHAVSELSRKRLSSTRKEKRLPSIAPAREDDASQAAGSERQRLKQQEADLRATLKTKNELAQALQQNSLVYHTPSQAAVVGGVYGKRFPEQPRFSRVLSTRNGGSSPMGSRSPSPNLSPAYESFDERLRAIFHKFDEDGR